MKRLLIWLPAFTLALQAADFNDVVLRAATAMPSAGGYSVSTSAHEALSSAVRLDPTGVRILANQAAPSYCSGATYLVFLKALGELQKNGVIRLDRSVWAELLPGKAADGQGVWGRWNANGPGTPRLFYELGLGKNFSDFNEARPGDFMKIFWTNEVGSSERGHSVVFLGVENRDGADFVRFWSSNKPDGYGEKSVPKTKIARAIFSRLEHPEKIAEVAGLPDRDPYLAGLLSRRSSFAEATRMSGIR